MEKIKCIIKLIYIINYIIFDFFITLNYFNKMIGQNLCKKLNVTNIWNGGSSPFSHHTGRVLLLFNY
jgi:hypothetical protein